MRKTNLVVRAILLNVNGVQVRFSENMNSENKTIKQR